MRLSCETFWNEWPLNRYTTIVDVVVVVVVGEEWKAQGSVELFVISRRGVRRLLTSYPILSSAYTYCWCVLLSEWVGGWRFFFLFRISSLMSCADIVSNDATQRSSKGYESVLLIYYYVLMLWRLPVSQNGRSCKNPISTPDHFAHNKRAAMII